MIFLDVIRKMPQERDQQHNFDQSESFKQRFADSSFSFKNLNVLVVFVHKSYCSAHLDMVSSV